MTKDEVLNIIRAHFVLRYNTLAFKTSNGDLRNFSVDNLVHLCEKIYNFGYEQGILDTLQGKVDKESIKMDTI